MTVVQAAIPYWSLSSFYFFYFATLGAWLPYWSLYLKSLGFNSTEIATLLAVVLVTKIISPNLWGILSDRSGKPLTVIRIGAICAVICFGGIFFTTNFWPIFFITLGFSFFWNAILSQFEVVTLSHLGREYARYSHIRLWGSIGFIALVFTLGWLFDQHSIIHLPKFLMLLLLGIVMASFVVSEPDRYSKAAPSDKESKFLYVLGTPVILVFFLVCFLMQFSHGSYYTFYSIYLESYGYSRSLIGFLWALGVVAEVVLFIFMHRLLAKYTLRSILLLSLVLAVFRWLTIGFFPENLILLILAQFIHAATFGSFHSVAIEMIRRFFPGNLAGRGQAFYGAVSFGAGGALGTLISGVIWNINPQASFLLASSACFIALILAWVFLPNTRFDTQLRAAN